mmetsp:Transcript_16303/g.31629  ORF Transcript_16303/g.31629 Transcript_16303/m.31629 type:complete len:299 (-) Transcript_16303:285-1181(-)|eukprot:CAMPEP_0171500526 /NCGR_PEP_ID=MMETSP0958-20121227/9035_1 /TAXON_ID=87120 /ORGANISM="Aurantiochytrium limacinum, Strain ATCCMYA-1381" /LENGTH=298 /DNA_ID=CAMNT_0012035207 /DNA_START=218 /DNA_END=1114 /DNA_ORIENTATION=-
MEFLAEKRKDGSRSEASEVVAIGTDLLRQRLSRLSTDQWSVREQVFLAALDCNNLSVAGSMLKEIEESFPESQRAARLRGLYLEAQGSVKEAAAVYDALIKENEVNMLAFKRKVCLLKATNKPSEAIAQLTKYLDVFQADAEAWKELALMHVEAGSFRSAVYCLEEVIMCDPHSYISPMALAEAKFSLGGDVVNVLDARKYFSHSLHLKEGKANPRALWGLMLVTRALDEWARGAEGDASKKKKGKNNAGTDDVTALVQRNLNTALNLKAQQHLKKVQVPKGMEGIMDAVINRFSCDQ